MSPAKARMIHRLLMFFWINNLWAFWLMPSDWRIPYLAIVSIYANFVGHWSGLSAERPTEIIEE